MILLEFVSSWSYILYLKTYFCFSLHPLPFLCFSSLSAGTARWRVLLVCSVSKRHTPFTPFLQYQLNKRPAHSLPHYQIISFPWSSFLDSLRSLPTLSFYPLPCSAPDIWLTTLNPRNHFSPAVCSLDPLELVYYNFNICFRDFSFS